MKGVARGRVGIIDLCGSGGGINLLYFFLASFWVAILIAILVVVRYVFENMHPSHFIYIHAKCHSHHFLNSRFHGKQFLWASNPLRQEHPHASHHAGHLARLP